jgi:hypothetical protein
MGTPFGLETAVSGLIRVQLIPSNEYVTPLFSFETATNIFRYGDHVTEVQALYGQTSLKGAKVVQLIPSDEYIILLPSPTATKRFKFDDHVTDA